MYIHLIYLLIFLFQHSIKIIQHFLLLGLFDLKLKIFRHDLYQLYIFHSHYHIFLLPLAIRYYLRENLHQAGFHNYILIHKLVLIYLLKLHLDQIRNNQKFEASSSFSSKTTSLFNNPKACLLPSTFPYFFS